MRGREKSNISASDPAIRSKEMALMRSPPSQLSSMNRRIDVWSVRTWLT